TYRKCLGCECACPCVKSVWPENPQDCRKRARRLSLLPVTRRKHPPPGNLRWHPVECGNPARSHRMSARPRNVFYAQSGGVTAVINASACGVIETARKHTEFGTVYAGRNGILGALREELIDTSVESDAAIAMLRHTPAGAFGSCRYKLKGIE